MPCGGLLTPADITEASVLDCFARSPKLRKLVREVVAEVAVCMVRKMDGWRRAETVADRVIAKVCETYGVTPKALRGSDRNDAICRPRFVAAWIMRQEGMSYPAIGQALGGRDHSTIMKSVRTVERSEPIKALAVEMCAGWSLGVAP